MSRPRPAIASAWVCVHCWNASRVRGSNVRRISSSSTVSETAPAGRLPPSGSFGASALPGVSST